MAGAAAECFETDGATAGKQVEEDGISNPTLPDIEQGLSQPCPRWSDRRRHGKGTALELATTDADGPFDHSGP
jgi:hypothetical protein